ncbi:hypothetical protein PR048_010001 [Dryococelus australis]|uniref:Uncharacterized protein n=1 Tax=Dryococelus australis TaxID=614101 RepID=A0ABQ9I1H1_9NEOP|nr:hypothetical protein PR048_010001 [Dryococelus australis]
MDSASNNMTALENNSHPETSTSSTAPVIVNDTRRKAPGDSNGYSRLWLLKTVVVNGSSLWCRDDVAARALASYQGDLGYIPERSLLIFVFGDRKILRCWSGSPPTTAIRARYQTGSLLDFHMWESCWTIPLAGRFSLGTPISSALAFQHRSILRSHFTSCPGLTGTYRSQLEGPTLGCVLLCVLHLVPPLSPSSCSGQPVAWLTSETLLTLLEKLTTLEDAQEYSGN